MILTLIVHEECCEISRLLLWIDTNKIVIHKDFMKIVRLRHTVAKVKTGIINI
jgi:hypothetical protein